MPWKGDVKPQHKCMALCPHLHQHFQAFKSIMSVHTRRQGHALFTSPWQVNVASHDCKRFIFETCPGHRPAEHHAARPSLQMTSNAGSRYNIDAELHAFAGLAKAKPADRHVLWLAGTPDPSLAFITAAELPARCRW